MARATYSVKKISTVTPGDPFDKYLPWSRKLFTVAKTTEKNVVLQIPHLSSFNVNGLFHAHVPTKIHKN